MKETSFVVYGATSDYWDDGAVIHGVASNLLRANRIALAARKDGYFGPIVADRLVNGTVVTDQYRFSDGRLKKVRSN